ncbi:spermatogenesis-associated protein 22 [Periophthalmus magnuspinnatus]|uniref:spermatogenesis-associated protein 22 n=1 Tax=Periophthalmus magnuspinnatus TaxID=409849 RepID=UPI00145B93D4|nr:spermatogenesis-associated protein 22 [Periophthalmus magnuspinnatus]
MKRQENQMSFPTAGCVPVPLFNQKKRARVPLTSAPPANEPFSFNNTVAPYRAAGSFGFYQPHEPEKTVHQEQRVQFPSQPQSQYSSTRPGPRAAPAVRQYSPVPHPYKAGNNSNKSEQTNYSVGQNDPGVGVYSGFNQYQPPRNNPSGPASLPGSSQMCQQQMSYKPPNATFKFSQQSTLRSPPVQARTHRTPLIQSTQKPTQPTPLKSQQQSKAWNFTNSFGPQPVTLEQKKSTKPSNFQVKTQPAFQMRPANGMSLRILTAVIDGMRHWSQFRDKIPYLFEIFATLDSAVTLGPHGAKRFIVRDGKEFVQCVYYENEKELPRLIRGQVHRCVGNYDRIRNVLVCVSIRPALPSEQRNAQEAVRVCDAEMRALVKTLSEV